MSENRVVTNRQTGGLRRIAGVTAGAGLLFALAVVSAAALTGGSNVALTAPKLVGYDATGTLTAALCVTPTVADHSIETSVTTWTVGVQQLVGASWVTTAGPVECTATVGATTTVPFLLKMRTPGIVFRAVAATATLDSSVAALSSTATVGVRRSILMRGKDGKSSVPPKWSGTSPKTTLWFRSGPDLGRDVRVRLLGRDRSGKYTRVWIDYKPVRVSGLEDGWALHGVIVTLPRSYRGQYYKVAVTAPKKDGFEAFSKSWGPYRVSATGK